MKILNIYTSLLLIGSLTACQSSEVESADKNDEIETVEEIPVINESLLTLEKWETVANKDKAYYILNYAGVESEERAAAMVDSLKKYFPKAGFLWVPDYASLSGKKLFSVFLDQSNDFTEILTSLENQKVKYPAIYVVKVNQSKDRWTAYSPIDIRVNDLKQKRILIYEEPQEVSEEDEDEYGSGDWAWFTDDVSQYFKKKHPTVECSYFYQIELLPIEIDYLKKKLPLEGLGYVLINGDKTSFIKHNMSHEVIAQACKFFGFKVPRN